MSNAWAVGRDESLFDPALGHLHGFIPERWLVTGEATAWGKLRPELPLAVFRQGKRVCQGKRTAIDGAFMQISSLLWAYDIEPVDPVDYYDMVVVEFMTEPKRFRSRLKPRGPWVEKVVTKARRPPIETWTRSWGSQRR